MMGDVNRTGTIGGFQGHPNEYLNQQATSTDGG